MNLFSCFPLSAFVIPSLRNQILSWRVCSRCFNFLLWGSLCVSPSACQRFLMVDPLNSFIVYTLEAQDLVRTSIPRGVIGDLRSIYLVALTNCSRCAYFLEKIFCPSHETLATVYNREKIPSCAAFPTEQPLAGHAWLLLLSPFHLPPPRV